MLQTAGEVRVTREPHILPRMIMIDGLTGTGKSMLGPILGSLERIELYRVEHIYEYLSILDHLGKLAPDASSAMLKIYSDLAVYNSMIGRETNFRPSDLSGVWSNPHPLRYLRRLFLKDGEGVRERIERDRPMIQVSTHQALPAMGAAFRAFGERLEVIEMVRHPLYLLDHWHSYIDRHGTDVRDFTIWIDHQGKAVPWFAWGWEAEYLAAPSYDRVIYSLAKILEKGRKTVEALPPARREQILVVPFENFTLHPDSYVDQICKRLGTERTPTTARIFKAQNLPRLRVMDGPAKAIYKRYAWKAQARTETESQNHERRWNEARQKATPEAFTVLEGLAREYESEHGLWFA